jgi:UDP-glucose 6-dehydrogenase
MKISHHGTEEQLQDNIINSKDTISYTHNYDEIINTDVTIILVNTPSNKADGSFSNLYVEQSLLEVSKRLKLANKKIIYLYFHQRLCQPQLTTHLFH